EVVPWERVTQTARAPGRDLGITADSRLRLHLAEEQQERLALLREQHQIKVGTKTSMEDHQLEELVVSERKPNLL
ncbi:unnamed protein product, partial [Amoebophrya sp. A25]